MDDDSIFEVDDWDYLHGFCTQSGGWPLDDKMAAMKKLKVLVFEYIIGGGLNTSNLPKSLAREGVLMLQSLVDDLAHIKTVEPLIMLDYRMLGKLSPQPTNIFAIRPEQTCHQEFMRLISLCDAVWPIAPESDSVLETLCVAVEQSGKLLLSSSSSAVFVAGNKWLTYACLRQHFIATVETQMLADFCFSSGEWMLKPIDGVGCEDSFLITDQKYFNMKTAVLDKHKYIIQPHIQGEKTSLSCLFKHGRGWLLCANRQHFELINQQYHLKGITVNFTPDISKYQNVVNDVAIAMPELWGYAGIDLIETPSQILILEINPRLTTSYAGIYKALGINCAKEVMELLTDDPQLVPTRNQAIHIKLTGKESHAS
jgi:tyramine---L-glutamate ligase